MKAGSIVAVGVFDGVHKGHQKLLASVVARAAKTGLKSVAVTFDPHPLKVISPDFHVPSLMSLAHRSRLIRALGIDRVAVMPFTKRFSRMTGEAFVRTILIGTLKMREIFVSEDFSFGRGAALRADALIALAKKAGFRAHVVAPARQGGDAVSSSRIRAAITKGDLKAGERLLGRPVSILGTVIPGARFARVLGYPTANIDPHHEVLPPSGVYAVRARCGSGWYGGVLNIGLRPTFPKRARGKDPSIEVHIFRFNRSIYGRDIEIYFIKKLRNERRFKDEQALVRQIAFDEMAARKALSH